MDKENKKWNIADKVLPPSDNYTQKYLVSDQMQELYAVCNFQVIGPHASAYWSYDCGGEVEFYVAYWKEFNDFVEV